MPQLSPYISYKTDEKGNGYLEIALRGFPMLRMSALNKGTAFTREERAAFSLEGLLPPRVTTLDDQVRRVYQGYLKLDTTGLRLQCEHVIQVGNQLVNVHGPGRRRRTDPRGSTPRLPPPVPASSRSPSESP